jgi:cytochrome P450
MLDYDPLSHALHEDPYPIYEELRERHPVYRNPRTGLWAISRYDDVYEALREPRLFSSRRIGVPPGAPGTSERRMPMMILMDPPEHDELRNLVNRAFTPRRIAALEPRVRQIARELIDGFAERGSCDLWAEFAAPLPTTVIAELLGIPPSDREMFKEQSTAVVAAAGPTSGSMQADSGGRANRILAEYLAGQFEQKRRRPGDDLLSDLLRAEVGGRKLTVPELLGFAILLLIAGNETTTNLIGNAILLLDRHPDQRRRLAGDPGLIARGIEEFLRCDSPVQGLERDLSEDLDVQGQRIPAGSKLFLLIAAANRDPRRFAEPERFDVARWPNRHLAFGFGTHFCLGASLARLEARVSFEELLARLPEFHVSGPVERLHSAVIRGLLRVPLEFKAAA